MRGKSPSGGTVGRRCKLGIDQHGLLAFRKLAVASLSVAIVRTRMKRASKNGRTIVRPLWLVSTVLQAIQLINSLQLILIGLIGIDLRILKDSVPLHGALPRIASLRLTTTTDAVGRIGNRSQPG